MSDKTCTVKGCDRNAPAKGLCALHYGRKRRHGTTAAIMPHSGTVRERLERNSTKQKDGCWAWFHTVNNFGQVSVNGKAMPAHRASWQEYVGEIPEGYHVRHTCGNRSCVNPDHLFLHLPPVKHTEINPQPKASILSRAWK